MAKKKPIQKQNKQNTNPKPKKKPVEKNEDLPDNWEEQVKTLTAAAMSIIHNEENAIEDTQLPEAYQKAQQEIQHPEDAGPKAVADVSLWVLAEVEKQVESQGRVIKPIIVMGAIGDICGQVAEVATLAGICEMSEEDTQIAVATAINKYVSQAKKEGKITDRQLQEAAQAMQKKYPDEVKQFQQMVAQREQRQKQKQTPQAPGRQPQSQGLLRR